MVLIVRADLEMPVGKIAAQVGHAVQMAMMSGSHWADNGSLVIPQNEFFRSWLQNSYPKIILKIDSLDKMLNLRSKADEAKIPNVLVMDEGRTCFEGKETATVLALGPVPHDHVHQITKRLRLLN